MPSPAKASWLRSDERGFTLQELVMYAVLLGILTTLGFSAFRSYWLGQALERGRDAVVTEMRAAQQRAQAESHPIVYGVFFGTGTDDWGLVSVDPRRTADRCRIERTMEFDGDVTVSAFTREGTVTQDATCAPVLGTTKAVYFYARGSATAATVSLRTVSGRTRTIEVFPITGRVESP